MNQINLIGRITKKPEPRYTQSNKAVCEFSLAVNRIGQDQADFINCVVWDKQAENLCKYQDKGSQIAVSGALRIDTFEVEGQKKYKTYVLANNIEYLESKKETVKENLTVQEEHDPFAEFGKEIQIDESEFPF